MRVCEEVRRRLESGGPLSDDLLDHLESCEGCTEVADSMGLLDSSGPGGGQELELLAATRARIDADQSPAGWLKSRPTWLRRTIALSVVGAIVLSALILIRRPDFDDYPTGRMLVTLGVMSLLLAVSLVLGLRPIHRPMLPTWMNRTVTTVGIVAAFVFAAMPSSYIPAMELVPEDPLRAFGMPCLYFGVLFGVPVYGVARLLDRGGNPVSAILAALAAGLTGNLVLLIHCPATDPLHQVFGHFTVVVAFVLAAAGLVLIERKLHG